jgi:hypothetical protein
MQQKVFFLLHSMHSFNEVLTNRMLAYLQYVSDSSTYIYMNERMHRVSVDTFNDMKMKVYPSAIKVIFFHLLNLHFLIQNDFA